MTDEQTNRAIAESCGWKWVRSYQWTDSNGLNAFSWDIPDYCTDLNAMHDAEKTLNEEQWHDYVEHVAGTWEQAMHTPARQRAEAFLRTLGKWEEGE